jgi:hypothetical protein
MVFLGQNYVCYGTCHNIQKDHKQRPTNPHWARIAGYGPFSLCVIHKEGLCPSSVDINRLMKMMMSRVVSGTK